MRGGKERWRAERTVVASYGQCVAQDGRWGMGRSGVESCGIERGGWAREEMWGAMRMSMKGRGYG